MHYKNQMVIVHSSFKAALIIYIIRESLACEIIVFFLLIEQFIGPF